MGILNCKAKNKVSEKHHHLLASVLLFDLWLYYFKLSKD